MTESPKVSLEEDLQAQKDVKGLPILSKEVQRHLDGGHLRYLLNVTEIHLKRLPLLRRQLLSLYTLIECDRLMHHLLTMIDQVKEDARNDFRFFLIKATSFNNSTYFFIF
jgi:hypothetical protein